MHAEIEHFSGLYQEVEQGSRWLLFSILAFTLQTAMGEAMATK